jgi:hypothetical protein
MSGVADHSLIEISDLDVDSAFGVRERSQIADVTVPANPHRRPFGDHSTARCFKPLVKFERVAAGHKRAQSLPSSNDAVRREPLGALQAPEN